MRHKTTIIIALVIAAILLVYMMTYQVGFNESAVLTTFGKAGDDSVYYGGSEETGVLGNLMLKWPPPIQQVRTYDMRVHMLEAQLEEQQTLDKQGVVVQAYVSWRITQPLDFYRSLVTVDAAENQIRSLLRDARSVIGNYTFDQLTSSDPEQLMLAQVEQDIQAKLADALGWREAGGQPWGIEFESVGIERLILPESVTQNVFERMRATRQRLAERARSEGTAIAADIVAQANSNRDVILAFAERRAQQIRAEGDAAAAEYYKLFAEAPEFAVFLRKLETYEEVLGNNATMFFDTSKGIFSEFIDPPAAEPETSGETPQAASVTDESEAEPVASEKVLPAG